jgi:putative endonuclease
MDSRTYFVYLLASKSRRLYVGVTNDLSRRVWEHKNGTASRFTHRYGINQLVHVETTNSPHEAIAREKQIKGWLRQEGRTDRESEPLWEDLAAGWT